MITKEEAKEKILNKAKFAKRYQLGVTERRVEDLFEEQFKDKYKHIETICQHDDVGIINDTMEYIIDALNGDSKRHDIAAKKLSVNENDEHVTYDIYLVWA